MPRFRLTRLLVPLAAAAFIALSALCLKSFLQRDCLAWAWTAEHHLNSDSGYLVYSRVVNIRYHLDRSPPDYFPPSYLSADETDYHPLPPWPQLSHDDDTYFEGRDSRLGFSYWTSYMLGPPMAGTQFQTLIIPYWAPLTLTALPLLIPLLRLLTRKRNQAAFEVLPPQKNPTP